MAAQSNSYSSSSSTTTTADYEGQADGINESGVPYIVGQNVENSVQGMGDVLAALGFSSVEEMMAAASAS
jgi:hypothetical protein